MKNIEERIIKIREAKGLSKSAIAEKLGFERQNYQYLEKRGAKLTYEQIENIATALDVSVQELLFGDSEVVQINEIMLKNELEKEYATKMEILELKLELEKSKKESANALNKLYEKILKETVHETSYVILEYEINRFVTWDENKHEFYVKDGITPSIEDIDFNWVEKRLIHNFYDSDYYVIHFSIAQSVFLGSGQNIDFGYFFEHHFIEDKLMLDLWYIYSDFWYGKDETPYYQQYPHEEFNNYLVKIEGADEYGYPKELPTKRRQELYREWKVLFDNKYRRLWEQGNPIIY